MAGSLSTGRKLTVVTSLLSTINGPADLKRVDSAQLPGLAAEIRDFLVSAVARTGGHLGPNLGVVELTMALHRVFDSPKDAIIWDTGHQSYVHKLLTGRRHDFERLRQASGLSGYPSRAESPHDWVENSHASTALSYADGLAKAFALKGDTDRAVVAVVGDGSLTGGMAWEALNTIAAGERPVVIVVNDNGRSYSPTVGGLAAHLAHLRLSPSYEQLLDMVRSSLARTPVVGTPIYDALHGMKKGLKDLIQPQVMFEDLGLKYVGPIDGHDTVAVEKALRKARDFGAPVIVHCLTEKGRGYPPAVDDEADQFHTVSVIDPVTGQPVSVGAPTWTDVFAEEIVDIGGEREDVVAITAAMLLPVGLGKFAETFPDRVFDVGIAEQHAVTSAAGLAMGGMHPVVCLYATFLNRAFDQVLLDIAMHRLPVTFVLDRAGVTGPDGASHHGIWDLAVLGVVPGMRVAAPRDSIRLRELLREAVADETGPTALRYPKAVAGNDITAVDRVGGMDLLRRDESGDVLIVAVGALAGIALDVADRVAAQGLGVTVVDPRWVLPVDAGVPALCAAHELVVVMEDGVVAGGVGSAVSRELRARGVRVPVTDIALPHAFLPHGTRGEVLADAGLSAQEIARQIVEAAARADVDAVSPR
ncbi:MAG: 1-deoxy-D-xylulose-5-phosphate synthase [Frankiaceae bacterium]|nr:1-deoxy-D-xylulose-5-phosphate synthase [Frankiaceae bacterium]MBV9872395.1 1-deoxy-D-xylulose-5-phosphate synthase [Frankiaceae bacterium]